MYKSVVAEESELGEWEDEEEEEEEKKKEEEEKLLIRHYYIKTHTRPENFLSSSSVKCFIYTQ